ncbi:predicted protein [Histoplasma capsulatum G186AR]|uniref:Uncharacterized protein n=1 Tax=Ajellomyces capsulatus (strain G186AR / H82 / ATCC MYA-2454 / RMSCC 2432) TaxID=447093 RepID=C0NJV4_AJECG|nr:uncharacterized protein HCBG_03434 [Histoplasma capsulatum G186AR]EEH08145.1 predicted protein [Histoplasma capsulatum G186AR]
MKLWQPNILMNLNPDFGQNQLPPPPSSLMESWSSGAVVQGILLIPNQALAAKHLNRFSVRSSSSQLAMKSTDVEVLLFLEGCPLHHGLHGPHGQQINIFHKRPVFGGWNDVGMALDRLLRLGKDLSSPSTHLVKGRISNTQHNRGVPTYTKRSRSPNHFSAW